MPRRSWRDLQQRTGGVAPASPGPTSFRDAGGGDLAQAANLAPDSRLGALMQQRQALEQRIQGLSGLPGQQRDDPAFNARFNVASFADRRAEEQRWADLRADLQERRDTLNRQANSPAAVDEFIRERRRQDGVLGRSPLEGRVAAGLPDLPGGPARGVPDPRSGINDMMRGFSGPRSGIGTGQTMPGIGVADGIRRARDGFSDRLDTLERPLQSGIGRTRKVTDKIDEYGRPLRQAGEQVENYQNKLRDLDSKLEAEGISKKERDEIRKSVGGDQIDKVGGKLAKANKALAAPSNAVKKVESGWMNRRQQIEGPMDRFSSYADQRERRLSPETGGSGDLFARMQRNRERALQRQREQQMQEQRDRRRHERAQENARTRREEEERNQR